MRKLKMFWESHGTILLAGFFIALIAIGGKMLLFNEYRASTQKLNHMIHSGMLDLLCVAPQANIMQSRHGQAVEIDNRRVSLGNLWQTPRGGNAPDRYIALVIYGGELQDILKISRETARNYDPDGEGCLSFQ